MKTLRSIEVTQKAATKIVHILPEAQNDVQPLPWYFSLYLMTEIPA